MIGVIGTSHRCADLSIRESIAKAFENSDARLKQGTVLLLTCNRAEWYFCTHTPAKTHQEMVSFLRQSAGADTLCHLYTFFGLECFRHLGKVVAGLDSIFIGETEIQGQVKAAYETARKSQPLPQELHFLFQRALHTGKVIRKQVGISDHHGLCDQVSSLALNHLEDVAEHSVLLIGLGTVNSQLAKSLTAKGAEVTLVNRTEQRTHAMAAEIGCTARPWEELASLWCDFPCVIAATRSQEYLLRPSDINLPHKAQLLIDLGVPRNIDPSLASLSRKIVNIEAFSPLQSIESLLVERSWKDYLSLTQRT